VNTHPDKEMRYRTSNGLLHRREIYGDSRDNRLEGLAYALAVLLGTAEEALNNIESVLFQVKYIDPHKVPTMLREQNIPQGCVTVIMGSPEDVVSGLKTLATSIADSVALSESEEGRLHPRIAAMQAASDATRHSY